MTRRTRENSGVVYMCLDCYTVQMGPRAEVSPQCTCGQAMHLTGTYEVPKPEWCECGQEGQAGG